MSLKKDPKIDTYRQNNHRHWCIYCKIFISPNKSAIQYHEKSDQHKASVQRHLGELYKKNKDEQRQKSEMDKEIRMLIHAGEQAYLQKDLGLGPSKPVAPVARKKAEPNIDPVTGMEIHPYARRSAPASTPAPPTNAYANANANYYNQQNYYAANYNNYNEYYNYNTAAYANYYQQQQQAGADYTEAAAAAQAQPTEVKEEVKEEVEEEDEEDENSATEKKQIQPKQQQPQQQKQQQQQQQPAYVQEPYRAPLPPAPVGTGFGEWTTVTTRILSDSESDSDDDDEEEETEETRIKKEARMEKRKRKQEDLAKEEIQIPEQLSDEEETRLRPNIFVKPVVEIKEELPVGPVAFKIRSRNKKVQRTTVIS